MSHKMYSVEVFHDQLNSYKIFINGQLKNEGPCEGTVSFSCQASDDKLEVWIYPWGIKPKVRINQILVDLSAAGFDLYDHKIDLLLPEDFFKSYQRKELIFQEKSIFGDNTPDPDTYDRVIGHGSMHSDLVTQIRSNLDV